MNCPFCQNQVLPKAYACGHCGRDLVPWLALMTDLEDRTKRLERLEKALGLPSQEGAFKMADGAQTAFVRAEPEPVLPHWNRLAVWVLVAWLGLLVAHWLLLFVYDASPLILRIVTMVLPLVLAMPANARGDVQFKSNAIMATLLAASSVAGMLALTAWLDDVAWLPENKRDWRETFEYTVAIL